MLSHLCPCLCCGTRAVGARNTFCKDDSWRARDDPVCYPHPTGLTREKSDQGSFTKHYAVSMRSPTGFLQVFARIWENIMLLTDTNDKGASFLFSGPMQEVPGDRQEASVSSGRHPAHRPFQPLRIATGASHRRSQRPHGRSDRTKMEEMPRLAGAHAGHMHHDSPDFPKYTCQPGSSDQCVSVFSPRPGCRGWDRIHCGKARKRATCFTGICIREKAVCGSPCPQYTVLWIAFAELRLTCLAGTAASSTA